MFIFIKIFIPIYRCQCQEGFIGDFCEVQPCLGVNCQNDGKCIIKDTKDSF